jgi:hypothetical protein
VRRRLDHRAGRARRLLALALGATARERGREREQADDQRPADEKRATALRIDVDVITVAHGGIDVRARHAAHVEACPVVLSSSASAARREP